MLTDSPGSPFASFTFPGSDSVPTGLLSGCSDPSVEPCAPGAGGSVGGESGGDILGSRTFVCCQILIAALGISHLASHWERIESECYTSVL